MPPTEMVGLNTGTRRLTFYPDTLQEENLKFLEESLTIDELKEAFRLFDNLGNGYITVERFGEILREIDNEMSDEELSTIISDIDSDNSNTIDFEEFVEIMKE